MCCCLAPCVPADVAGRAGVIHAVPAVPQQRLLHDGGRLQRTHGGCGRSRQGVLACACGCTCLQQRTTATVVCCCSPACWPTCLCAHRSMFSRRPLPIGLKMLHHFQSQPVWLAKSTHPRACIWALALIPTSVGWCDGSSILNTTDCQPVTTHSSRPFAPPSHQVIELIKRKPRESPSGDFIPDSGTLHGSLELQGVVFAYPGRPTQRVLSGLNLSVSPGRCLSCLEGITVSKPVFLGASWVMLFCFRYSASAGAAKLGKSVVHMNRRQAVAGGFHPGPEAGRRWFSTWWRG